MYVSCEWLYLPGIEHLPPLNGHRFVPILLQMFRCIFLRHSAVQEATRAPNHKRANSTARPSVCRNPRKLHPLHAPDLKLLWRLDYDSFWMRFMLIQGWLKAGWWLVQNLLIFFLVGFKTMWRVFSPYFGIGFLIVYVWFEISLWKIVLVTTWVDLNLFRVQIECFFEWVLLA